MQLESISLQNWKGYRRATLNFPQGDAERNIVLVEGANGAGKTSLMEGVILALYGREGLNLIGRAHDGARGALTYDAFLERALNQAARGDDAKAAIELVFRRDDGRPLAFERVWHFSAAGRHRSEDEEVRLREGEDGNIVPVPEAPEREPFLRDYLEQNLLPANLATFFIFDGENVDRLAGHDLEGQVRAAAEQVLGVPLLRQTAQDLKNFARDRRRESRETTDGAFEDLRTEVTALEAEEERLLRAVEAANSELQPVRKARDDFVRRIGALHCDSYASFKTLFEEREAHTRIRTQDQEELRRALSVDLALALSGPSLRASTSEQLAAESVLDEWDRGRTTSQAKFGEFLTLIVDEQRPGDPAGLRAQLTRAWDQVWLNPPAGSAAERRHVHLGETERVLVLRHLDQISVAAGDAIAQIARRLELADKTIERLERRIAEQRGLDDQAQSLADELRDVQQQLAALETAHRLDVESLDALRLRLTPLRQDLSRRSSAAEAAAPALRRADKAEAYARALEEWVETALPERLEALSEHVTHAYRAMAHKGVVAAIKISTTGTVELLDAEGRDIRQRDASAGESQIFALALMSAIAGGAGRFPILMDTPFARLDPQHRANVIRHFAGLGLQVILLAHPAEILQEGGELVPRLAGRTEVVHSPLEGYGVSRLLPMTEAAHGA